MLESVNEKEYKLFKLLIIVMWYIEVKFYIIMLV